MGSDMISGSWKSCPGLGDDQHNKSNGSCFLSAWVLRIEGRESGRGGSTMSPGAIVWRLGLQHFGKIFAKALPHWCLGRGRAYGYFASAAHSVWTQLPGWSRHNRLPPLSVDFLHHLLKTQRPCPLVTQKGPGALRLCCQASQATLLGWAGCPSPGMGTPLVHGAVALLLNLPVPPVTPETGLRRSKPPQTTMTPCSGGGRLQQHMGQHLQNAGVQHQPPC